MPRHPFPFRFYPALGCSLLAAVSLAAVPSVRAQQADAPAAAPLSQNTSLKQLMSPEDYKASGLRKLSPDELAHLERFLQGYREQATQEVAKATEERVNPPPTRTRATHQPVVENAINGPFTGLKGRTRVVLRDGSIWQQANDDKFSCHLDSPDVVLVRTFSGYKMYVTGAPHWFYVRQVVL